MERKKLIIIATFIVIIIVSIIIENFIRGIGRIIENSKESKIEQQQIENYKETEEYKETVKLEGIVGDVVELLNDRDFDILYSLLDSNYKDYKFQNNKGIFDEYIKEYINEGSKVILQTYERINDKYVCRLLSENRGKFKSFLVLIGINESDNSYNIIFDDITSIKEENKSMELDNLKYDIKYIVTAKSTLIYTIEFTNLSNKDINYKLNSVSIRDTSFNEFITEEKNLDISLKPGELVRKNLTFYSGKVHKFPKVSLDFHINGMVVNMYIEDVMWKITKIMLHFLEI